MNGIERSGITLKWVQIIVENLISITYNNQILGILFMYQMKSDSNQFIENSCELLDIKVEMSIYDIWKS